MAGRPQTRAGWALLETLGIEAVCERIAGGDSLNALSVKLEVNKLALSAWLKQPNHADKYAMAQRERAHRLVEEALQIADDATPEDVHVAKLRVDARRWFASKLHPGAYGDKLEVNGKLLDVTQLHMQMLRELTQRPAEKAIEGESFSDTERLPNKEATPVDKGE